MGGSCSGMSASLNPFTRNVSNSSVTFSPLKARRRKRTVSRTRAYWRSNASPFQFATMTSEDAPRPQATRPGAASANAARLCASSAGPRVYTGVMATPRLKEGSHAAARVRGVNPSAPSTSADHRSV